MTAGVRRRERAGREGNWYAGMGIGGQSVRIDLAECVWGEFAAAPIGRTSRCIYVRGGGVYTYVIGRREFSVRLHVCPYGGRLQLLTVSLCLFIGVLL